MMYENKVMFITILMFILKDQCWTTINPNEKSFKVPNNVTDIVDISSGDTSFSLFNRPTIINLFVQMLTMIMTKRTSHHPFPLKCNQILKNFVISNQKICKVIGCLFLIRQTIYWLKMTNILIKFLRLLSTKTKVPPLQGRSHKIIQILISKKRANSQRVRGPWTLQNLESQVLNILNPTYPSWR